jgi:hypothetical protein
MRAVRDTDCDERSEARNARVRKAWESESESVRERS